MSLDRIINTLPMPKEFFEVASSTETRNRVNVDIIRYQPNNKISPNNEHITIVMDSGENLISYNNYSFKEGGNLPDDQSAIETAVNILNQILPDYSKYLSYMRTDYQYRSYTNVEGKQVEIPVMWIKFAHNNGTYNWVTLGPNSAIIEIEIESEWDYMHGRRSTEMWNNDDWVLARRGEGPQLQAPSALA
ncbi:hypothetical protein ESZ50_10910 [Weissella muntiaci]|uniref:Uncharacterized protein n=2 Tax=Weissella muntiaci TaxID=2508881 RepID=A0A6C2C2X7_9LACO|nr:hypothetical protein [Weissella muntiaci]TYC47856.1 hypothetical protein ESZ50_10910 [Weissella muntiaci]